MKLKKVTALFCSLMFSLGATSAYSADKVIKVGVIATLEGPYAALGTDAVRGVKIALEQANHKVNGYKLELIEETSNADPTTAIQAAKKLIENHEVDVVVGPLGGSEGIAIKEHSKKHPNLTFINGSSAAQGTTLKDPSANFFRFGPDGVQMMAGLGEYAYKEKGYKKIVTIAEDYSWSYSQHLGFLQEFCAQGGEVLKRHWVKLGEDKYSSYILDPTTDDADALLVTLGGTNATKFLRKYVEAGGETPIIGGSITVDQSILSNDNLETDLLKGIISARGFTTDDTSDSWKKFSEAYSKMDGAFNAPSLFATHYYDATVALVKALGQVSNIEKDLNSGQKELKAKLAALELDASSGRITLDDNRQAITNNFVTQVVEDNDGTLYNQQIKKIASVDQNLGLDSMPVADKVNPTCEAIHQAYLERKSSGSISSR